MVEKAATALCALVLGAAFFAGLCYVADAWAQYPKNTQVQRFSDGRVVVSTSPGAGPGPIRSVPQVTYGNTTYLQHYKPTASVTREYLGGYLISTDYIISTQPQLNSMPVDHERSVVIPAVMTICTHNGVGADQVTQCKKYK